jgi:CDP-glucose 4,6-dehydratase
MKNNNFWKNKKVFLTGHTGFKGSWLAIWLNSLGAKIKGYSLEPPNNSFNLYSEAKVDNFVNSEINDICNYELLCASILKFSPDIIFHMAAQPLVRLSYEDPLKTFETNIMGTANILNAASKSNSVKAIVNITTDKCYENNEWYWGYKETDPMGGKDPYSSSKGCSELVTTAYRESFFRDRNIGIATARAGNVIGGGDWAKDRLIPDILKSFQNKKEVIIRNPNSIRPWQHVLEPLRGYLILAEKLFYNPEKYSEGWNFGPYDHDVKSVEWITSYMTKLWPNNSWKIDESRNPHEANLLKLDISKAIALLKWSPVWNLETTLKKIVTWHQLWLNQGNMHEACLEEIYQFTKDIEDQ